MLSVNCLSVCKSVDIFLVHYQTDAPLIHILILLNSDLVDIVTRLAKRVVKLDVLDKCDLKDLKLNADGSLLECTYVDLGNEAS